MKNILIAFSGKARSGKGECSNALEKIAVQKGLTYKKISFADGIKDIAREYFDWDGSKELYILKTRSVPPTTAPIPIVQDRGRQLLINIGQHFRAIRPTIWADIAYKRILKYEKEQSKNVVFCIDDLRFKNEIDIVRKYSNSLIVRVVRENGQLSIDDISEKDCDDVKFSHTINNNGSLEDLAREVEKIYNNATL